MAYPHKIDLLGKRFVKLLVIGNRVIINQRSFWPCKCDCGNEKIVKQNYLLNGDTKSCGCLNKQTAANNIRKSFVKIIKYTEEESVAILIKKDNYSDSDLTLQEFIDLIKKDCYYCGAKPMNKKLSPRWYAKEKYFYYNGLDRVDNSKGHYKDNVVPCCIICNRGKRERTESEFKEHMESAYQTLKEKGVISEDQSVNINILYDYIANR